MIWPYVFACERDAECLALLVRAVNIVQATAPLTVFEGAEDRSNKLSARTRRFLDAQGCRVISRLPGWFGGEGWNGGTRIHIDAVAKLLVAVEVAPTDHVVKIDSDAVFSRRGIFDHVAQSQATLSGFEQGTSFCSSVVPVEPPARLVERVGDGMVVSDPRFRPTTTRFGEWAPCSGALIFIRGDIAAKIPAACEAVRRELLRDDVCPSEDVGISYAACYCGAQNSNLMGPYGKNFLGGDGSTERVLEGFLHEAPIQYHYVHYGSDGPTLFGAGLDRKWNILSFLRRVRPDIVDRLGLQDF